MSEATGSGAAHPFVIPLTKIDVERRLVIGTAAEEIADKSREIMDYATARPQFEEWSNGFHTATGGLSKGNLRVMHTKTVAGRLDAIDYDDATKKVQIVAKVSDDNEWKKCLDGAYTGFSIGGGYLRKWKDPDTGLTRYTPIVREISLVDNPCMPTATFAELVKADGVVEQLPLHGVVRGFAASWGQRPVGFGEAWGAAPAQGEAGMTFGALFKAAGHTLSDAEHQERINAAKARWAHEGGHDLAAVQASDDHALDQAKSAMFGRARKVRAVQEHQAKVWNGIADNHEAYDKALPHLPRNSHGLMILGQHSVYDPTGVHKILSHQSFDPEADHVHGIEPHEVHETVAQWKQEPGYDGPRDHDDVHAGVQKSREATAGRQLLEHARQHSDGLLAEREAINRMRAGNAKYGTNHIDHPGAYRFGPPKPMSADDAHFLRHGTHLAKRKIPKRAQGQAVGLPRDWSEAKHPRGQHGKFTSGTGRSLRTTTADRLSPKQREQEPLKQAEWDTEHGRENRVNVLDAAAEGASGAAFLATRGPTTVGHLVQMARFGVGEKADRNVTAAKLRGDRKMRSGMVRSARHAAESRLGDFNAEEEGPGVAAAKARRKVMQEAQERGSSPEMANAEADRFAAILARRTGKAGGRKQVPVNFKDGVPARYASRRAADAAARAAKQNLRGNVLRAKHMFAMPAGVGRGGLQRAVVHQLVVGGLAGTAGAALGAQAAYRLQREQEDHGITGAHHVGATAGDLARALSGTSLAEVAGGVVGIGGSLHRQGFRLGSKATMIAGLGRVNPGRTMRAGIYGGLIGAGLNVARNVPTLAREYAGRAFGSKEG